MRLTWNYLLNFRSFTLAIALVLLGVSAQAQTAEDKNWTIVGSAGTLDESAVGKVFLDHSIVQMGRVVVGGSTSGQRRALIFTQTQSAVIRYNVTAVEGLFVPRSCLTNFSKNVQLRLRYLATGPGARVVAKLIEVDLTSGSEKSLLAFDSSAPGVPRSNDYQVQSIEVCGRTWNFDFNNKAYYIEATLTGNSIAATSAAGIQMIQIDNFTRNF